MSINKVGSSAGVTALRGISVTPSFQTHIGSSVVMLTYSQCHVPWRREPDTVTQIASSYNEPPLESTRLLDYKYDRCYPTITSMIGLLVVDLFCLLKAESEIIEYRSWSTTLDQLSTEESCCCFWRTAIDTLMKLGLISIFLILWPVHRCHLRHEEPLVLPFWCSAVWTMQG